MAKIQYATFKYAGETRVTMTLKDLIEALKIFLKYGDEEYPTYCEHDVLLVTYDIEGMSEEDINELEDLGFYWDEDREGFISFKYGSC